MTLERKVAIIHRDQSLIEMLSELMSPGFSASTMLVDRTTTPWQVADFIAGQIPDIVLLAENYQGNQLDPDPQTRGEKMGEGIGALVEIRRAGYTKPIYMVSGSAKNTERVMQAGANGYLPLPLSQEEFVQLLESNTQS